MKTNEQNNRGGQMTPEAQRITIAKACGHHPTQPQSVPDYLKDLNAMHEAEKLLKADSETGEGGFSHYNLWLHNISTRDNKPKWHLNAAQRAEAFLRTLNLWEEAP